MTMAVAVVVLVRDAIRVLAGAALVVIRAVVMMRVRVVMGIVVRPLVDVVAGLAGMVVVGMLVIDAVVVAVRVTSIWFVTDQIDLGRQPYEGGSEHSERAEKGYQEYPNTTRPARHLPPNPLSRPST